MPGTDNDPYAIRDDYYDWCSWLYEALKDRLALKLRVHPDTERLHQGHIFLFNHFARFETIFPPYLIYRITGAHTRSIADHKLFEANEGLSRLMRGLGVMPNNQPGLLAFLAAEILRGRKVVVFPEGGMVKDRRVIDERGTYGIRFPQYEKMRGHHRGAAVLALTLDIFKKRILELDKSGDAARLGRWVKALGLRDEAQLLARAQEPTLIVPSTITFYPLRIQENVLSRLTGMFAKGLPKQAAEELLIEGNLIFRDTDMDIRLNPPIYPDKKWRWWEKRLLNRYFLKINSLEEFFGLRDHAEGFAERMLAHCIARESTRLRDAYMYELYTGTTINLSHLASCLIAARIEQGHMEIGIAAFHKALYVALKRLQTSDGVHLHRSLASPDHYGELIDGISVELDRFLDICKNAGLVGRTRHSYRFLDKLCHEYEFHEVRIENPLLVYTNEAAPIAAVRDAIETALKTSAALTEKEIAAFLFDDELRAHARNRQYFAKSIYREINDKETATQDGAPYLLLPEGHAAKGVLLVHGFLASPAELRDFGERLSAEGYAVLGVRLAGHGTSPWDLKTRSWTDWLNSVRRGYRILSAFADKITIVGFSAGGALSLILAAEHPRKLTGVVSVSAPLAYRNHKLALVPLMHGLNKMAGWIPSVDNATSFRENDSEHPDINYHNIPISALQQLRTMTGQMEAHLSKINVPTLIVQGDDDPVVDPNSARKIFKELTVEDKTLRWISSTRHGIFNEDIGGTCALVEDFIVRADTAKQRWTRHDPPPRPALKSVYAILGDTAARMPGRPCFDFLGKISTYGEVRDLVVRAAKGLQQLGVKKGDRVGLCLPNSPYYIISYYAALKAGATVVNFNPLYTKEEIRAQIADSGASVMVTLDIKTIYPKVAAALQDSTLEKIVVCSLSDALPPVKELLFRTFKRSQLADIDHDERIIKFDELLKQGSDPYPVHIDPETDIALLQYTGGTTGTPKGAMLTHANVSANTEQVQIWMGEPDPDGERVLCVLPFFHVFAMTAALNLGIAIGSELILLPKFDLDETLTAIDSKRPTLFPAVPTIFNAILGYEKLDDFDLSSIRFCISGGAPLPAALKEKFEILTGCVVVEGYGLTEASPVVACNPPDAENKPDSIGLPLTWTDVEIRDIDDPDKALADGERGELAVRGPQIMTGYWQRPEDTAAVLRDNWLMTGDVGHVDADGYLFLTDRLKDVIICSGFKVYPRVIEEAFYLHPDVDEVTVVGIPDDYRGETPKAFVKLKDGTAADEEALLSFVADKLNPIERPSAVEIRDSLPKTMIGKLSKKELAAEHREARKETRHG